MRLHRKERGNALIEFALVVPFMLVLTFCMVDVSRAFWIKNVTTQAAREGARYLVVHTAADTAGVRNVVQTVVEGAGVTLYQITLDTSESIGAKQWQVLVRTRFNWLYLSMFNFWKSSTLTNPVTLTATCTMRKEG